MENPSIIHDFPGFPYKQWWFSGAMLAYRGVNQRFKHHFSQPWVLTFGELGPNQPSQKKGRLTVSLVLFWDVHQWYRGLTHHFSAVANDIRNMLTRHQLYIQRAHLKMQRPLLRTLFWWLAWIFRNVCKYLQWYLRAFKVQQITKWIGKKKTSLAPLLEAELAEVVSGWGTRLSSKLPFQTIEVVRFVPVFSPTSFASSV